MPYCELCGATTDLTADHVVRRDPASPLRTLCRRCNVQQQCLDYSIQIEEGHGIWGGLNELERKRLLRRRRAESA